MAWDGNRVPTDGEESKSLFRTAQIGVRLEPRPQWSVHHHETWDTRMVSFKATRVAALQPSGSPARGKRSI